MIQVTPSQVEVDEGGAGEVQVGVGPENVDRVIGVWPGLRWVARMRWAVRRTSRSCTCSRYSVDRLGVGVGERVGLFRRLLRHSGVHSESINILVTAPPTSVERVRLVAVAWSSNHRLDTATARLGLRHPLSSPDSPEPSGKPELHHEQPATRQRLLGQPGLPVHSPTHPARATSLICKATHVLNSPRQRR
jgi:hypothetical protein